MLTGIIYVVGLAVVLCLFYQDFQDPPDDGG